MIELSMDLYRDWIDTARVVFRGSNNPLPEEWSDQEVAEMYFRQTFPEEEAVAQAAANEQRIRGLEQTIELNLETVIIPDIRARTGYKGNRFQFRWVYNQGEHLIETHSQYRVPLG
ncbi:hypothetical protein [Paenibacillus sp. GCM10027626]|uniref:hypothetical protein n=1 Tax=Paenibacillus sp. GCM10027626 TaxID=3273411 RepID=UPI00363FDB3F